MIEQAGSMRLRNAVGSGMISLEIFAAEWRSIQIGKDHSETGYGINHGLWRSVAGFIRPGLEMTDFGAADTEQDPEHFQSCDSLGEHRVKTGSPLLDRGEMEAGRIGNHLREVCVLKVVIGARDRRMLAHGDAGNRLRERVAEIGVPGPATIPRIPGCIDRELHQIREAPDLLCAARLAARECAELIEIDGLGAF